MGKATTVSVERTSTARVPLGRRLGDDQFEPIHEAVERIVGVRTAYLDDNGQLMVIELTSTHTGKKKADLVLTQAAKAAGVNKIEVVHVA